jgi:hypothetical protein
MSTKPVISSFSQVASLLVHEYERYLPTAFDESLSLLEKVNKVIQKLNEIGVITNDVITQWNTVMEWVMNDGLTEGVNERLDEMVADGTLDTIINQNIFGLLNTRLDDVEKTGININQYVGSVVANDWLPAFNEAIADLPNGGKIFITNKGTAYELSSTLTIPSNITIEGIGNPTIKARVLSAFYRTESLDGVNTLIYPLLYAQNVSNVLIKNITLDTDSPIQVKGDVSPILFVDSDHVKFEKVKVLNNASSGSVGSGAFNLFRCTNSVVEDCEADNIDTEGLLLRDCDSILVKGGDYRNSSSTAVGTQNGSNITMQNVHAHDTANSCMSLNSNESKVIGCTLHDSDTYAPLNLGHRTTYATRKPANRAIVTGNHIYNGHKAGIYVGYGRDIEISDNVVHDCRGAFDANDLLNAFGGISPSGWVDRISVHNNKIYNCNRGIYTVGGRSDVDETTVGRFLIQSNEIFDCPMSGIDSYDSILGLRIKNNELYNNNTSGDSSRAEIRAFYNANLGQVDITDNMVGSDTVRPVAIRVQCTTDNLTHVARVTDNIIRNCTSPIVVSGTVPQRIINRNNIIDTLFQTTPRHTIDPTGTSVDIGYSTFMRMTPATALSVDTITSKHGIGTEITIQAGNGNLTLVDGANLQLASTFVSTTNDIIVLVWTGGQWIEKSRALN